MEQACARAIIVSKVFDLSSHGVSTLGPVPGGLPHFGLPSFGWNEWVQLLGTAASIFVVVLAGVGVLLHQRATTKRGLAVWGSVGGLASVAALVMGILLAG